MYQLYSLKTFFLAIFALMWPYFTVFAHTIKYADESRHSRTTTLISPYLFGLAIFTLITEQDRVIALISLAITYEYRLITVNQTLYIYIIIFFSIVK